MYYLPIEYHQPLFRPPSEGNSLILQVTLVCSNNECAFCEMYKTKKFTVRKREKVQEEILNIKQLGIPVQKIFLADGDAFVLSKKRLLEICTDINDSFPNLKRISAYALPSNINSKSIEDLVELRKAGIKLLYIGIESGDNEVLESVSKGETYASTKEALLKLKKAGIKASVMVLIGLGGKQLSKQHAIESAKLVNETQPEFVSTLVLSFPYGVEKFKQEFRGEYEEMNQKELLEELRLFIQNLELQNSTFRSNHASNYLVLKGQLNQDKDNFLALIDKALEGKVYLRPEWVRGL